MFNFDGRNIKSLVQSLKTVESVTKDDINYIEKLKIKIDEERSRGSENFADRIKVSLTQAKSVIKDPQLIDYIDNLIEKGEKAKISLADAFSFKYGDNTKGFKNVSQLIKDFNALGDSTGKATDAQKELAQWTKTSNSNLGKYFSTVKDGKASFIGYGASLVGATLKTIALEAATIALNAAISFGISFLIQALITGISNVIHYEENLIKKQEELRESAKNLTEQYKSAKEAADKLNKSSGDLINRYAKLSQGVDALGNNVSLTNEEYEEYKNLCNQIADDVPNLIKAYDDEGNAILTLRDNVNALKTAYQEAAKEKYSALLDSDDIENALKAYSEFVKKYQQIDISGMGVGANTITVSKVGLNGMSNLDAMKVFEQLLKERSIANISLSNEELQKIFNDFNIDYDWGSSHSNAQESKMYQDVSTALAKLKLEYSIYQSSLDSLSNAILHIYDGFYELPSELQTIANAVANNLPDSLTESLTGNVEEDKAKIAEYVYNIVDKLNNPEVAENVTRAYKQIFSVTKKDLPVNETLKQVQMYVDEIVNNTGMNESDVRKIFGLDEFDNISQQLNNIKQRFIKAFNFSNEEIRGNFFDGLLNELSGSDIPNTEKELQLLAEAIDEVSKAGGKSTDVIEVYKQKLAELNNVTAENAFNLEEYVKQASERVKFVTTVTKEMTDQGYISASTYAELVAKGDDYTACLEIIGGKLTVNVQKLKDLEKQEYQVIIAEKQLELAEWSAKEATSSTAKEIWEKCNALKEEIALYQQLSDDVDNAGVEEPKKDTDDPIKDAFQKRQKELEHLLNMEQITEAEYYKRLFDSKEYKALLADREKYADELNSIDEKFYKFQQTKYKEDADKQFDALDEQFKAGKISAEAYAKALNDLGQSLYGEGTLYAGTETAKKELESLDKKVKEVADDIYSEFKEGLGADGDRTLDNVIDDARKLSAKSKELFADDLKTLKKNSEDIFSSVAKSAQDAFERGLITPERFFEIIQEFSDGIDTGTIQDAYDDVFDKIADKGKDKLDKMLIAPDEYFKLLDEWGKKLGIADDVIQKYKDAVSESDYLDRWDLDNGYDSKKSKDNFELRKKRIEYIYELAEKLYGKDGQKDLKAYNALINQGLEDVESLVEDYYDKEIEKLEKINEEEEKREKALELQLNLIKARQKLEDAKKQKNQLVFHNGTFEYMADQEVIKSAEEDVAEAQKAILEQEREDQKQALEDQKTETLKFFNGIDNKLDDTLKRIEKFFAGDKDAFKKTEDDFDAKMQKEWGLGNVDLTKRPKVKMDDGSTATVLSGGEFVWQGDEENGGYVYVTYTPILPDGTILTDDELGDYIMNVLEGTDNILAADKNGKGIVLKVDDNLNLTDEDIKSIEAGDVNKWTDHVKELNKGFEEWAIGLHNIQAEWLKRSGIDVDDDVADATVETKDEVADVVTKTANISSAISSLIGIANIGFETLVNALGGKWTKQGEENFKSGFIATSLGKQSTDNVSGSTANNSNTTNNAKTVIHIDKIFETLQMPQGTTKEQVEEFFKHLNQAILQRVPQVILDVKK